ncbi:hypothetical protein EV130_102415 [Rhizobium azibense]|uniref:Uncharacterized protein n=2 Tax=Rhizobium azibense TaxID=1136135 RepID=A0A4V6P166_9HYPH|nr:hypothetical protein EV130_102415 [Rhizobium azibense]
MLGSDLSAKGALVMMMMKGNCAGGGHRTIPRLWGVIFLLVAKTAFADTFADTNVVSVIEGGHWQEDGAGEGSYRIIVVNQGFEHVSSRVVVEWKSVPTETGEAKIVHSVELVKGGFYSIGTPELTLSPDGARVELRGTSTYGPAVPVVCRFDLSPGGKVTLIKGCEE